MLYAGQPVGIIVAESREIALKAADKVKISYSDLEVPNLTIKDVIKIGDESLMPITGSFKPEEPFLKGKLYDYYLV